MATVNPIPEGMHTVTPNLTLRDAAKAIDFYKRALGAQEGCARGEGLVAPRHAVEEVARRAAGGHASAPPGW